MIEENNKLYRFEDLDSGAKIRVFENSNPDGYLAKMKECGKKAVAAIDKNTITNEVVFDYGVVRDKFMNEFIDMDKFKDLCDDLNIEMYDFQRTIMEPDYSVYNSKPIYNLAYVFYAVENYLVMKYMSVYADSLADEFDGFLFDKNGNYAMPKDKPSQIKFSTFRRVQKMVKLVVPLDIINVTLTKSLEISIKNIDEYDHIDISLLDYRIMEMIENGMELNKMEKNIIRKTIEELSKFRADHTINSALFFEQLFNKLFEYYKNKESYGSDE